MFFFLDGFDEEPLNPQESIREKTDLVTICGNEYLPIRIILKLTVLFQLFSKFRKNVVWPVKAKPKISAKIFVKETLKGLCIETENSAYFWRLHNRIRKSNYLITEIFVVQKFFRNFSSPSQNFVNFFQLTFLPLYKKDNIWKKVIQ